MKKPTKKVSRKLPLIGKKVRIHLRSLGGGSYIGWLRAIECGGVHIAISVTDGPLECFFPMRDVDQIKSLEHER